MAALTSAVGFFRKTYPNTPLRLYVEALGGVIQPVLDGRCRFGVIGTLPTIPDSFNSETPLEVPFVTVVRQAIACPSARVRSHGQGCSACPTRTSDRTAVTLKGKLRRAFALTWRLPTWAPNLHSYARGSGGHMPLPDGSERSSKWFACENPH